MLDQTIAFVPQDTGAKIILFYNNQLYQYDLGTKVRWEMGRETPDNKPDIPVDSRLVSRQHGAFSNINNQWYYTNKKENLNGTYYNGTMMDRGISTPVKHGDMFRIDSRDIDNLDERGVMILFLEDQGNWTWHSYEMNQGTCQIGRNKKSCQIVLDKPYISNVHAKVSYKNGKYYLADMGSMTGTFMNGGELAGEVELRQRDSFYICDRYFFFCDGSLIYNQSTEGKAQIIGQGKTNAGGGISSEELRRLPTILHADIKTKLVKDMKGHGMKELIRDIHLDIKQGSLVALLGTAGAGKSTVMNCLNGMDLIGVEGSVKFKNVELMTDFDRMSYLIGAVPQDKVFHPTFTPEEEFRFAAKMRLPGDTSKQEIERRVNATIKMLGMEKVRNNQNVKLSGGEKSRVNVGIELVADRELLCLDEPDAGLSPDLKHDLFMILRDLAHEHGKSILTIIHDVSEIHLFDQVIILVKADNVGRLAFSGTPEEARKHFGCDVRDVYALVSANPEKYVLRG